MNSKEIKIAENGEEKEKNIEDDKENLLKNNKVEPPSNIIIPFDWNGYDAFCLVILIALGVFTRFWVIQNPRCMTNNEKLHLQVLNSYINGTFVSDINPPLASMINAGSAYLAGYNVQYNFFSNDDEKYTYTDMQYVSLRSTPAFFASIVVPLSFFIVRSFGGSCFAAFSCGLFTVFDFLLISLGRTIDIHGIVQFFIAFTLFLVSISGHFRDGSEPWLVVLFFESLFVGFSISSTLSAIGLWLFVIIFNFLNYKNVNILMMNIIIPFIVFVFAFCYSSTLMPFHSPFDKDLDEKYQIELFNINEKPYIKHRLLIPYSFELIKVMFKTRYSLPNGKGKYFTWPFMLCNWYVIWNDSDRYVSCFGNVAVWWPICIAIIFSVIKFLINQKLTSKAQMLCIGYFSSLLFFQFGCSATEICDYEIPLIFGLYILTLFIDQELDESLAGFVFTTIIIISCFLFIIWCPLVYGYENFDQRFKPYFMP